MDFCWSMKGGRPLTTMDTDTILFNLFLGTRCMKNTYKKNLFFRVIKISFLPQEIKFGLDICIRQIFFEKEFHLLMSMCFLSGTCNTHNFFF